MQEYGLQLEDVHAIGFSFGSHVVGRYHDFIIQGLSERMAKVKRFLWAQSFKEIRFSQLSLVVN